MLIDLISEEHFRLKEGDLGIHHSQEEEEGARKAKGPQGEAAVEIGKLSLLHREKGNRGRERKKERYSSLKTQSS